MCFPFCVFCSQKPLLDSSFFVLGCGLGSGLLSPPDLCVIHMEPAVSKRRRKSLAILHQLGRTLPRLKPRRALWSLTASGYECTLGSEKEHIHSCRDSLGILHSVAKAGYQQLWLEIGKASCWKAEREELYWIREALFWTEREGRHLGEHLNMHLL